MPICYVLDIFEDRFLPGETIDASDHEVAALGLASIFVATLVGLSEVECPWKKPK